ncbi:histidine phosphatase family protein [Psychrobacter piechaudii]|uniref:Histidine phosphatase superfamily (Branch 1) n=1 Tax=Psychrobacter piechaudii TaxID=1945521 RepID=A0A1R4GCN2_9GAMM|nr:histidine phosphatase family protein [Psychrobacter piechaudii]SJM65867.1 Histidine phosphatase superfamily (branch 1) [Psychrobacter piechaudii]
MTTLLFARHGQASFGQKNYDKLSSLGAQQATLLGQHYANTQRKIDAIVTGSLVRQQDSATHFISAYNTQDPSTLISADPTIIEELNEFNHKDVFIKLDPSFATEAGIMQAVAQAPVPKARLAELFNDAMIRWHSGQHDEDYLESWPQFNLRAQQALQKLMAHAEQQQAKNVLVFTSGGVIAAITAGLLNQSNDPSMTAYQINRSLINTGVTSVVLKGDTPRLLSLNEHSHLYHQGQSLVSWH